MTDKNILFTIYATENGAYAGVVFTSFNKTERNLALDELVEEATDRPSGRSYFSEDIPLEVGIRPDSNGDSEIIAAFVKYTEQQELNGLTSYEEAVIRTFSLAFDDSLGLAAVLKLLKAVYRLGESQTLHERSEIITPLVEACTPDHNGRRSIPDIPESRLSPEMFLKQLEEFEEPDTLTEYAGYAAASVLVHNWDAALRDGIVFGALIHDVDVVVKLLKAWQTKLKYEEFNAELREAVAEAKGANNA